MPYIRHTPIKYNKTTAPVIYVLVGMIVTMMGFLAWQRYAPLCKKLTCISVTGIDQWKETDIYELSKNTYRALLQAPSYTIRVEKHSGITSADAATLTKVRTMQMSGLFDEARSPYPGILSDRIRCDDQLKPQIEQMNNEGLKVVYVTAWVNNRLQYGTCVEGDLPYKSYSATFYCAGEKALYQIELITEREKANDDIYKGVIASIRCQK